MQAVEILPDASTASGDHAIIRLDGVWLLPDRPTVRLEAVGTGPALRSGTVWPHDDVSPLDMRLTSSGVELRVGPDVVDRHDLRPGSVVRVNIPSAGIDTEVVWPDLKAAAPAGDITTAPRALPGPTLIVASEPTPPALAELQFRAGRRRLTRGPSAADEEAKQSAAGTENVATAAPVAIDAAHKVPGRSTPPPLPRGGPHNAHREEQHSATAAAATAAAAPGATTVEPAQSAPAPQPARHMAATAPAPSQRASSHIVDAFAPLAVGFLVTIMLLGVLTMQLEADMTSDSRFAGSILSTRPVTAAESQASDLFDLLEAGERSPRGLSPAGLSGEAALALANRWVHGLGGDIDREEAGYWLRRALASELSDEHRRWALTQLGTIFASPAGGKTPDYRAARMVWQFAGAIGDPVALCFLGQLHEHGLGVAADRREARQMYEMARQRGGCTDVEAALTRVRG
ncbi:MAG: hypothetical protein NW205_10180 [Hyphomicrobiaceae bacterium]|nr:hypothetical protein [Hyphomicrobiaceae bacterium]